jgi:hypothetical protein
VNASTAQPSEFSKSPPETRQVLSPARASRRLLDDEHYILRAWTVILIVAAVDWIGALHAGFEIGGIFAAVQVVMMFAGLGFVLDYFDRARPVSEATQYCALWIAFSIAILIYSYVVATLRMPMWDARFARMDSALGFNWNAGFAWATELNWRLQSILNFAYGSMMIQVFASIAYFVVIKRSDRNRELLWIGMLAVLISISLSGLFPALGPYGRTGMPPWSAALVTIRNGGLSKFTLREMTGIVAFPSCHAITAIVLVYVHRPPLRSFVPVAILNALMLIATPFAGHHYLVDILAGAAMVAVSILIVQTVMRPRDIARLEGV